MSSKNTTVRYFRDGNQWACVPDDFLNAQESPVGFGDTPQDAAEDLYREQAKAEQLQNLQVVLEEHLFEKCG